MKTVMIKLSVLLMSSSAFAVPAPPELEIPLTVSNITAANNEGAVAPEQISKLVNDVNSLWAQCAINFTIINVANIEAQSINVPYKPRSQSDLGRIASAVAPTGFQGAIPLTIAGPWNFFDPISGVYLNGLGWAFVKGDKLDRLGVMVSATKLKATYGAAIIGHELGHALMLGESNERSNLMSGGKILTKEQCEKAKGFARKYVIHPQIASRTR